MAVAATARANRYRWHWHGGGGGGGGGGEARRGASRAAAEANRLSDGDGRADGLTEKPFNTRINGMEEFPMIMHAALHRCELCLISFRHEILLSPYPVNISAFYGSKIDKMPRRRQATAGSQSHVATARCHRHCPSTAFLVKTSPGGKKHPQSRTNERSEGRRRAGRERTPLSRQTGLQPT